MKVLVTKSRSTLVTSEEPARLLCPWNSPGKNTGVGGPALLQGIFPTQGLNPGLLHCRRILYYLSYQGSSFYLVIRYKCESWTIEKAEY